MVRADLLRKKIVSKHLTQEKVANAIGITPNCFSMKLKRGVFLSSEIETMISVLDLKDPAEICRIFFDFEVKWQVSNGDSLELVRVNANA